MCMTQNERCATLLRICFYGSMLSLMQLFFYSQLWATESGTEKTRAALTVNAISPITESMPRPVLATGSIEAWQEAVIAVEVGGLRITQLHVDVGSIVRKGQPLAELSQESVLADVEQQQARVNQAKAELAEAKTDADRARAVKGSAAMSEQEVKQYLIKQDKEQANLNANEAMLNTQKIRQQQTSIVAVDDGVISSRSAQLGAVNPVGTELFRLIRQNRLEWRAHVAAMQADKIHIGQIAQLRLNNGATTQGTVRLVAPTFDTNTRTLLVYVDLPSSEKLRPGLFAQGEIIVDESMALTLPQSAIVFRDGYSYVFEINKNQQVSQRKVVIGRQAHGRIEVVDGIESNATLVLSGGAFLNDGDSVRVEVAK